MRDNQPDVQSLFLEELRAQFPEDGPEFDPDDFLYAHGSPLLALLYRRLFWPEFREVDGAIVWGGSGIDDDQVRKAHEKYGRDREATEKACNFIEVTQLLTGNTDDVLWEELVRSMMETWRARLAMLYPGRHFVFEFFDMNDRTGEEMGFWFYQA